VRLTKRKNATLWEIARMSDTTATKLAKIVISQRIVKKA
jgi:hypothetical protein